MASRRGLAVLAAMLVTVALSAGCSRGKVPATEETSAESPRTVATATTTTTPAPSDEDQVREAVMAFQDAYNTQNWDAYPGAHVSLPVGDPVHRAGPWIR